MRGLVLGTVVGAFLFSVDGHAQSADWEILNRFRTLAAAQDVTVDQDGYVDRIISIRNAKTYLPLIAADLQTDGSALNWPTNWDVTEQQYRGSWLHSKTRSVKVTLKGIPKTAECVWKLKGAPERRSCEPQTYYDVPLDQTTPLEIIVTPKGGSPKTLPVVNIEPRDVLIAMLGDSYGSGEGNPHLSPVPKTDSGQVAYPAIWWDARCHRSLLSSAAQAAGFLAYQNKKQSVTFVSYACSGAEIDEGILKPFAGRQTIPQTTEMWQSVGQPPQSVPDVLKPGPAQELRGGKDLLKPQIDRLAELLCVPGTDCASKIKPDVLLIAVGGNDIAFGEIGRELLMTNPKGDKAAWRRQKQDELTPIFKRLNERFDRLAKAVQERIQPKSVYLYEYVDPTQYSLRKGQDRFCGTAADKSARARYGSFKDQLAANLMNGRAAPSTPQQRNESNAKNFSLYNILLTMDEGRFANWVVQNLDSSIRDAGKNLKWTDTSAGARVLPVQDLHGPDGLRRGVCAPNSWFIGVFESWKKQDWIPEDKLNAYPLILGGNGTCTGEIRADGKCWVPAGPITSGILHPNFFGHYNVGQVLLRMLKRDLAARAVGGANQVGAN